MKFNCLRIRRFSRAGVAVLAAIFVSLVDFSYCYAAPQQLIFSPEFTKDANGELVEISLPTSSHGETTLFHASIKRDLLDTKLANTPDFRAFKIYSIVDAGSTLSGTLVISDSFVVASFKDKSGTYGTISGEIPNLTLDTEIPFAPVECGLKDESNNASSYDSTSINDQRSQPGSYGPESQDGGVNIQGGGGYQSFELTNVIRRVRLALNISPKVVATFGGKKEALAWILAFVSDAREYYKPLGKDISLVYLNAYTDLDKDPFCENYHGEDACEVANFTANQTELEKNVGSANFDVGHLIVIGAGGVVSKIGEACDPSLKAKGLSGAFGSERYKNPYTILITFLHELGHQFSAHHTWSICGLKINDSRYSLEFGSGVTIMSYAGICGPLLDIIKVARDYFHHDSIESIGNNTCGQVEKPLEHIGISSPEFSTYLPPHTQFYIPLRFTTDNYALSLQLESAVDGPNIETGTFASQRVEINSQYFSEGYNFLAPFDGFVAYDEVIERRGVPLYFYKLPQKLGGTLPVKVLSYDGSRYTFHPHPEPIGASELFPSEFTITGEKFKVLSPEPNSNLIGGSEIEVRWTPLKDAATFPKADIYLLRDSKYTLEKVDGYEEIKGVAFRDIEEGRAITLGFEVPNTGSYKTKLPNDLNGAYGVIVKPSYDSENDYYRPFLAANGPYNFIPGTPTPVPTATPTSDATSVPTSTPTAKGTVNETPTAIGSPEGTSTPTPTAAGSKTALPTPSGTATPTPSPTGTGSSSPTPTPCGGSSGYRRVQIPPIIDPCGGMPQ